MEEKKEQLKVIRVSESAHQVAKVCAVKESHTLQNYIELLIMNDAMKKKSEELDAGINKKWEPCRTNHAKNKE